MATDRITAAAVRQIGLALGDAADEEASRCQDQCHFHLHRSDAPPALAAADSVWCSAGLKPSARMTSCLSACRKSMLPIRGGTDRPRLRSLAQPPSSPELATSPAGSGSGGPRAVQQVAEVRGASEPEPVIAALCSSPTVIGHPGSSSRPFRHGRARCPLCLQCLRAVRTVSAAGQQAHHLAPILGAYESRLSPQSRG